MSLPTLPASAYEALGVPETTVRLLTTAKPFSASDIASPNLLNARTSEQHLAKDESSIVLYAELLLHIRTVTLFASLKAVHTRETRAKLSTDGCEIVVSHEGEEARIRLPVQVQGGGDAALQLPAQPPSKELTLRLQIEEKEGTDMLGALQSEDRKVNITPWDGATLTNLNNAEICCKSCGARVVEVGRVKDWRDLPNENWAEMMDFWHCHKPDEHHLHDHTHEEGLGKKGYAAGNRLRAMESVGFVDLTSFLLAQQDCEGMEISSEKDGRLVLLHCKNCKNIIGTIDDTADGWRIWKWCIGVALLSSPTLSTAISFPTQRWVSARLLSLIENTGVRKFHIHASLPALSSTTSPSPAPSSRSTTSTVPSFLLWVFTPDLFYSSSISSPGRKDPTRSMKVFYQHQAWTPPQPGEVERADVEELEWPGHFMEELKGALEESGRVLPVGARKFKGWDVALLGRFDIGDVQIFARGVEGERKGKFEASNESS